MRYSTVFALSVSLWAAALSLPLSAQDKPPQATRNTQRQPEQEVTSLDALLSRLARLEGMAARYREEKRIALLREPLRSEGKILFAAPNLLLRRCERPEPSTLLLRGTSLQMADATGKHSVELSEHPALRHFVMSFVYVLSGNRAALDKLYNLRFETKAPQAEKTPPAGKTPQAGAAGWTIQLSPKEPALSKLITRAVVHGRGVTVDHLTLHEASGDTTELTFSEVDLDVRYGDKERARIFRLPAK